MTALWLLCAGCSGPPDAGVRWYSTTLAPGRMEAVARPESPSTPAVAPIGQAQPTTPPNPEDFTVQVVTPESVGGGLLIASSSGSRHILTSAHVLGDEKKATIRAPGLTTSALLRRTCPLWDLALLDLAPDAPAWGSPLSGPALRPPDSTGASALTFVRRLEDGRPVHIPLQTMGEAVPLEGIPLIQVEGSVLEGDSGSPVMTADGLLAGLLTARRTDLPGQALMTSSVYLLEGQDALLRSLWPLLPLRAGTLRTQLQAMTLLKQYSLHREAQLRPHAVLTGYSVLGVVARSRAKPPRDADRSLHFYLLDHQERTLLEGRLPLISVGGWGDAGGEYQWVAGQLELPAGLREKLGTGLPLEVRVLDMDWGVHEKLPLAPMAVPPGPG